MSQRVADELPADPSVLAASLEPQLLEATGGRLDELVWFRTDWQHGGAATGRAKLRTDDGRQQPVIIKVPIVQRELVWLRRLQTDDKACVVPRVYDSGETLGGHDLAWVVIEELPHGPLGTHWHTDHVQRVADAAARFYATAAGNPIDRPPRDEPWEQLVKEAQASLRVNQVQQKKRWSAAMKALRGRVRQLAEHWRARPTDDWLHGDLQLANAMSRESLEAGPVCLIDLAEVRPGHWIEDAVYLERQLWTRPDRLRSARPVKAIGAARRRLGLAVSDEDAHLAAIRRALLAGTALRYIRSEGHPRHLSACLEWLERSLAELK